MDQMLDRLAGYAFYYFLNGYSGYNQIAGYEFYYFLKDIQVIIKS